MAELPGKNFLMDGPLLSYEINAPDGVSLIRAGLKEINPICIAKIISECFETIIY